MLFVVKGEKRGGDLEGVMGMRYEKGQQGTRTRGMQKVDGCGVTIVWLQGRTVVVYKRPRGFELVRKRGQPVRPRKIPVGTNRKYRPKRRCLLRQVTVVEQNNLLDTRPTVASSSSSSSKGKEGELEEKDVFYRPSIIERLCNIIRYILLMQIADLIAIPSLFLLSYPTSIIPFLLSQKSAPTVQ